MNEIHHHFFCNISLRRSYGPQRLGLSRQSMWILFPVDGSAWTSCRSHAVSNAWIVILQQNIIIALFDFLLCAGSKGLLNWATATVEDLLPLDLHFPPEFTYKYLVNASQNFKAIVAVTSECRQNISFPSADFADPTPPDFQPKLLPVLPAGPPLDSPVF